MSNNSAIPRQCQICEQKIVLNGSRCNNSNPDEKCALGYTLDNKYRLDAPLGKGGIGFVYDAYDTALNQEVSPNFSYHIIVKEIRNDKYRKEEWQILTEFRYSTGANFIPVIHTISTGGRQGYTYIIMEKIRGKTLNHVPKEHWSLNEVRKFLKKMLENLDKLHMCSINNPGGEKGGILHRDLKPNNIMLRDGTVDDYVLIDFGQARLIRDTTYDSSGTPRYAPPEQFNGIGCDERSDLFSLGMTACHLLIGSQFNKLVKDLGRGRDYEAGLANRIPLILAEVARLEKSLEMEPKLTAVLSKLIQPNPIDRPESAQAALKLLEQLDSFLPKISFSTEPLEIGVVGTTVDEPEAEPTEPIELSPIKRLGKGKARAISWSPDGNLLAVASEGGIFVYHSQSNAITLKYEIKPAMPAQAVTFWQNGAALAALLGADYGEGKVWTGPLEREQLNLLEQSKDFSATGLAFQSNGEFFGLVSNRRLRLGQVGFNQLSTPDEELEVADKAFSFSPYSALIAAGLERGKVWLYSLASLRSESLEIGVKERIIRLAFAQHSREGELLAVATNRTVTVLNLRRKEPGWDTIKLNSDIICLAFEPNGKTVAVSTKDGDLTLFMTEGSTISQEVYKNNQRIEDMAFAPNSKAGTKLLAILVGGRVELLSFPGPALHTLEGHYAGFKRVGFLPGTEPRLVALDNLLYLWNWQTEVASLQRLTISDPASNGLTFTRGTDGKLLLGVASSEMINIWQEDVNGWKAFPTIETNIFWPGSLQFIRNGTHLLTVSNSLQKWGVADGKFNETALPDLDEAQGVAVSENGRHLAILTTQGGIKFWQIQKAVRLRYEFSVEGDPTGLALAPTGNLIAVLWLDRTEIWKWDNKKEQFSLFKELSGGGERAVFSSDKEEKWLALVNNKAVALWRWKMDYLALYNLEKHTSLVSDVAFYPAPKAESGRQLLATASQDGMVLIWEIEN